MRISDKKQTEVYNAISDPIMTERLAIEKRDMTKGELDARLLNLEIIIWRRVHAALNLQSTP